MRHQPEGAAHRTAEGAASAHRHRSKRFSIQICNGPELSGRRELRCDIRRILQPGVRGGEAIPVLRAPRIAIRVPCRRSQLRTIQSERRLRRQRRLHREQGDRAAVHLHALPAERGRAEGRRRRRRRVLDVRQPQFRDHLQFDVRQSTRLIFRKNSGRPD